MYTRSLSSSCPCRRAWSNISRRVAAVPGICTFSRCKPGRIALDSDARSALEVTLFLAGRPVRGGDRPKNHQGETTMTFITMATEEFPGSLPCALTVRDCRDGTNCFRFTVYTDDLRGLQEYVEAHNAGNGEFKLDLCGVGAGRALNAHSTPAHAGPPPASSSSIRSRCRSRSRRRPGRRRETCFGCA